MATRLHDLKYRSVEIPLRFKSGTELSVQSFQTVFALSFSHAFFAWP